MSKTALSMASGVACPRPLICPLSQVQVGTAVRIKQIAASPAVQDRLREMGFCEEQRVRLVSQRANFICQVCNVRMGISAELAESIWVEPIQTGRGVCDV